MNISFCDLKAVNHDIENEIQIAIKQVIESGWYILGKKGGDFESNLAKSLAGDLRGYAVGCNSGTDALVLSLLAAGVGVGDEVITVSNTAIPTVTAIHSIGAIPKFVDICPDTWLMNTQLLPLIVSERTRAIIPVHLYGNMVDMDDLAKTLKSIGRNDIVVIEDVAQAHGAVYNGKQAGTIGDFGAFSFYPSKNIGALGDAGAIFSWNQAHYEKLCMLRNYGQSSRYELALKIGLNSRLDEIQAAILDIKLKYLTKWNHQKDELMGIYRDALCDLPIKFQRPTPGCLPGWHLCVVALEDEADRNGLARFLGEKGVQTIIHYPIPNHSQIPFADYYAFSKQDLIETTKLSRCILSLPMNIALNDDEQMYIIERIHEYYEGKRANG